MGLRQKQGLSIQQKAHNIISHSSRRLIDVADYCKGGHISIDNGSGMYNEFVLEEVELCNRHLICKYRNDAYKNSLLNNSHTTRKYNSITRRSRFYTRRRINRKGVKYEK